MQHTESMSEDRMRMQLMGSMRGVEVETLPKNSF